MQLANKKIVKNLNSGVNNMKYEVETVNEFGTKIPPHVAKKAKEMGCNKPKYIYKDGEWMEHGKFSASNINIISRSARFGDAGSAESHKVTIIDDWVAFKSPSGSGSRSSNRNDGW